jgi:crotonobetaine/carnitine-CoA ligase
MNATTPPTIPRQAWTDGSQDTVPAVLRRAAAQQGERPYLDCAGRVYSYAQTWQAAKRLANGLRALGVQPGDTVVTLLDNSAQAVFTWLAINLAGAISVPLNTAYKGEFLRHQAGDAAAALLIAESDYAERVLAVASGLPTLRRLVYRGPAPAGDAGDIDLLPWQVLESEDESDPAIEVQPRDLALLIYTGGTTGLSKGCMISHNYACNQARQMLRITERGPHTVTWTPLPVFHSNAVLTSLLCNLMVGAQVALYGRFSVSNFWPEIERSRATDCALLGTMFTLLAHADDNATMLRCKGQLHAAFGAPFPPEIQAIWQQRFGVAHTVMGGYGLSECAIVTTLPFGRRGPPGSAGQCDESFDVRIVDNDDRERPPGTPGEIIVRPRQAHVMFEGYWKRPEDTLKVMRNQWFHTGDIGKFDENGYFYFLDRKKDYLRRKGENISSMEVENAFHRHPEVEEVAAHAVLSELSEDELKVTVVRKAGSTLSAAALFYWSAEQLPYFAVPRYIEFRCSLPRNPVGRLLKYQLRDEGVTPSTWDQQRAGLQINKR